jgi:hypothetical protein
LNTDGYEALLEHARRLEAEAITLGEEGQRGRALRAEAAASRLEALGERPYPVVVCDRCFTLTGWLDAGGSCDRCARRRLRLAAEAASGGFARGPAAPGYLRRQPAPPAPLSLRLAARLGRRQVLARTLAQRWAEHVEPDLSGPIVPEPGYELEAAFRDEVERCDAHGILVRFTTATVRFAGAGGWERLETTRLGRSALPNPAEFAAELPIEALAEAWGDYRTQVTLWNRRVWVEVAAAREQARSGALDRAETLREQQNTSQLLKE